MNNKYCVIIGKPGVDAIAVSGPYDTEEAAQAEVANYPAAHVDILIAPQNLQEARDANASSNH